MLDFIQGLLFGGGVFIGAIALTALALYLAVVIVFNAEDFIKKLREKLS